MPPYLSDLIHPYYRSGILRSLDTSLLTFPRFSLETFRKRSFSFLFLRGGGGIRCLVFLAATPQKKNSVSWLSNRNLKPVSLKIISAKVQKCTLVSACIIQQVCVGGWEGLNGGGGGGEVMYDMGMITVQCMILWCQFICFFLSFVCCLWRWGWGWDGGSFCVNLWVKLWVNVWLGVH